MQQGAFLSGFQLDLAIRQLPYDNLRSCLALHLVAVGGGAALKGHATAHGGRQDAQTINRTDGLRDRIRKWESTCTLAAEASPLAKAAHSGHLEAARAAEEAELADHRVVLDHADWVGIVQRMLALECTAVSSRAAKELALAPAPECARNIVAVAGKVVADAGTKQELALRRAIHLETHLL